MIWRASAPYVHIYIHRHERCTVHKVEMMRSYFRTSSSGAQAHRVLYILYTVLIYCIYTVNEYRDDVGDETVLDERGTTTYSTVNEYTVLYIYCTVYRILYIYCIANIYCK